MNFSIKFIKFTHIILLYVSKKEYYYLQIIPKYLFLVACENNLNANLADSPHDNCLNWLVKRITLTFIEVSVKQNESHVGPDQKF